MSTNGHSDKRWEILGRDSLAEAKLQKELGISSLAASVLVARGYTDPAEADAFLNPTLEHLHDPKLLPDYEAAKNAILGAKERKERIFIHGDYDVDGVTSAALFSRFLRKIDCDVVTHVPHRMKEGYGIHSSAVDAARASGAKLFLTCDCGVSAVEQVAMAREFGMDVVVTDHHSIGHELPNANAVINPHREDSVYPFHELSGVGVAFKLCEGLTDELGVNKHAFYRAYLDLAALGTIADVMPLSGENRIIAKFGLQQLGETKKPGLKALMQVAEIKPGTALNAYHVGFLLGPRLNAAGRIDDAAMALKLLLETEDGPAITLAQEIDKINTERREEQNRILQEAIALVEEQEAQHRNVIVIAKEDWHSGVIGIVAGRLVELFRRPTFVFTMTEDGHCKGSARSIPNFHLANAIRAYPELMSGGGHAMAAGCSFPQDKLQEVSDALHTYAGGLLTEEDFIFALRVDAEVTSSEINRKSVEELQKMEPFGCDNPKPQFLIRDAELAQIKTTRNPDHIQVRIKSESGFVWCSGFNMAKTLGAVQPGAKLDLVCQPTLDEWNGNISLKWRLEDYRPAETAPQLEPEPSTHLLPV